MTIEEILEQMDVVLDKAVAVPFSSKKSLVDVEQLRELIDEVRYNLPKEITNAKQMVYDRSKILNDAKKEAESIIKVAEDKARLLLKNDEVVKNAKLRAAEIINNATIKDNEIKKAMNDRIDDMLNETEKVLAKNVADIHTIRSAIKATAKKNNQ